jgi:CshA-type fibril repeat protein
MSKGGSGSLGGWAPFGESFQQTLNCLTVGTTYHISFRGAFTHSPGVAAAVNYETTPTSARFVLLRDGVQVSQAPDQLLQATQQTVNLSFVATSTTHTIAIAHTNSLSTDLSLMVIEAGSGYFCTNTPAGINENLDTDGDGIPNRLDLDSDGDGCSDANEAYNSSLTQGTDGNQQFGTNPITVDATGKITSATYTGTNSNYISAGSGSTITTQPVDQSVTPGSNAVFTTNVTTGSGSTTYQWQVSVDGGNTWSNVTNPVTYTGAGTSTLTVTNVPITFKGYRYRLQISQSNYVCGNVTSSVAKIVMNNTPSIVDDAKTGAEDAQVTDNVLTNDSGSGGSALTVTSYTIAGISGTFSPSQTVTIPNVGTIVINANGSYTFTPTTNYNGTVPAIDYTATDANGGSDIGTLVLTITPVNDAPLAVDDVVTTNENTAVSGNVLTDGADDSDVDGNTLRVTQFTIFGTSTITYNPGDVANIPGVGSITMNANGSYTFTPTAGYTGSVPNLDYTLSDGNGGSDVGRLQITVVNVNDAPLATDDILTIDQQTSGTGNLLTNDTDIDAGSVSLTITTFSYTISGTIYTHTAGSGTISMTDIGTINIAANGVYTFVPSSTYTGQSLQLHIP